MNLVKVKQDGDADLGREKGKVTFAKAAEMVKLSLWEFADLVKQRNVEWVGSTPEEM